MRYGIRALVALAVASAMAVFSCNTPARADSASGPLSPSPWRPMGVREETVRQAARFALQEQARQSQADYKLLAIKHARQQVVAGMNYSMNLLVQAEGERRLVIAVVWIKPDGSMELTRWHWV